VADGVDVVAQAARQDTSSAADSEWLIFMDSLDRLFGRPDG
jgi:hypothetical protein